MTAWAITRERLIADLRENGPQASWDWEADRRWAAMTGDEAMHECITVLIENRGVAVIRANYHDAYVHRPITLPRLRALRRLVSEGHAKAYWMGMGEGSRGVFGVSRVRVYALR